MHTEEIESNRNLLTILQIIYEKSNHEGSWVRYREVYTELSAQYRPDTTGKGGRQPKLSIGTFSKWTRRLIDSLLISQKFEEGSYKQKMLRLTGDGVFTYMFYKNQTPGG